MPTYTIFGSVADTAKSRSRSHIKLAKLAYYYFKMDKFDIKRARLECTARPTEDNTSTTTVTTAIKPTITNDDYNCLNNVQSSASANTTVVESAQCSASNNGGHQNSSGVKAQKTKQKRDVGRRTFRQEWPIKYPWLLYDMPTERVFL